MVMTFSFAAVVVHALQPQNSVMKQQFFTGHVMVERCTKTTVSVSLCDVTVFYLPKQQPLSK
jgi:hypothetical protein